MYKYMHHNLCFNLFMLDNNSSDNQGNEINKNNIFNILTYYFFIFFLIGIYSMQGWTATTKHGVTKKEAQKRLQDTHSLFRKNLQLKDVC